MSAEKSQEKSRLHPRNRNRDRYDLQALIEAVPDLKKHVSLNKYGTESVDFSNPTAVKLLNTALLKHYYNISYWEFKDDNLCPPIPGRADYIHYIADLLCDSNGGKIPTGPEVVGLDIGTGATCIYPILGVSEYNWSFIATDINPKSIESSQKIIEANPSTKGMVECMLQSEPGHILKGILTIKDKIDFTICNPPFHASKEEAMKESRRKVRNLTGKNVKSASLNFSGQNNELIYEGGEIGFIKNLIRESSVFSKNCLWFTSLVSKESNLKAVYRILKERGVARVKTIPMGTGNKTSRIVAWTYHTKEEERNWRTPEA